MPCTASMYRESDWKECEESEECPLCSDPLLRTKLKEVWKNFTEQIKVLADTVFEHSVSWADSSRSTSPESFMKIEIRPEKIFSELVQNLNKVYEEFDIPPISKLRFKKQR